MKLLLTGLPGAGKTTLLKKLMPALRYGLWVLSQELKSDHQRAGFMATTSTGMKGIFAHKTKISSSATVGNYSVDIEVIDKLFAQPILEADTENFVIVDEIGRMQMLSPKFHNAISHLFDKDLNILATIRFGDDWTKEFTGRDDTITFTLTCSNREEIEECLLAALRASDLFNELSARRKKLVTEMANQYLKASHYIQIKKLFNNALVYLSSNRVEHMADNSYKINGNHSSHRVVKTGKEWSCDCDLFNGKDDYAGNPGVCSHIQAVTLL